MAKSSISNAYCLKPAIFDSQRVSASTSTASPSTEISSSTTNPWWSAQCLFHQQISTVWQFWCIAKITILVEKIINHWFLSRNLFNFQAPTYLKFFLGRPPAFHITVREERRSLVLAGRNVMKAGDGQVMGWTLISGFAKSCYFQILWLSQLMGFQFLWFGRGFLLPESFQESTRD